MVQQLMYIAESEILKINFILLQIIECSYYIYIPKAANPFVKLSKTYTNARGSNAARYVTWS